MTQDLEDNRTLEVPNWETWLNGALKIAEYLLSFLVICAAIFWITTIHVRARNSLIEAVFLFGIGTVFMLGMLMTWWRWVEHLLGRNFNSRTMRKIAIGALLALGSITLVGIPSYLPHIDPGRLWAAIFPHSQL